jgi:uncharacterized membrane protein YfcA
MLVDVIVMSVALLAGAVASLTGFGIGSLLTPALALQVDARLAVAAVSIPHLVGTAIRFTLLRPHVDWRVVWSFGMMSAAGGLTGALLQARTSSRWLSVIFGTMLLLAAASELTGLARRFGIRGAAAWAAGAVSGLLGGLVGNQGGIRAAALVGFPLAKDAFVATATAVALAVDAVRLPIYLATQLEDIATLWRWLVAATIGVVIGTVVGRRLLARLPDTLFRRTLAGTLAILGAIMVARGMA